MPTYTEISNIGQIDLRVAFRKLLNANLAKVPPSMAGDKTAARWLASCVRGDLEKLVQEQALIDKMLELANNPKLELPASDLAEIVEDKKEKKIEATIIPDMPVAETKAEVTVATPPTGAPDMSVLASMIAPFLKIGLDEAKMRSIVQETVKAALDGAEPRVLIVKTATTETKTEESRHVKFERLLGYIAQRKHVFLVGPAGTGKSHAAHQAATALGLNFHSISVGLQSTQADLFGYMNAHGTYVETEFYRAYKNGGVFCLDECDGGSASVLNALNSALANGSVAFPCGRVTRHADFVVVATGNTYGNGKTLEYVGRAVLDGAFLSRFARMFWPTDEKMERKLGPILVWTNYVIKVRKLFDDKGIRAIISPRISIDGGRMLLAGQSVKDTVDDYIRAGLTADASKLLDTIQTPTL